MIGRQIYRKLERTVLDSCSLPARMHCPGDGGSVGTVTAQGVHMYARTLGE